MIPLQSGTSPVAFALAFVTRLSEVEAAAAVVAKRAVGDARRA